MYSSKSPVGGAGGVWCWGIGRCCGDCGVGVVDMWGGLGLGLGPRKYWLACSSCTCLVFYWHADLRVAPVPGSPATHQLLEQSEAHWAHAHPCACCACCACRLLPPRWRWPTRLSWVSPSFFLYFPPR